MWWQYIIIAAVILFGIYGFLTLTSFETRVLSRRTTRSAADLYPRYADSLRKQRRYAKEHGGEWTSDDGGHSRESEDTQPHEHGTAPLTDPPAVRPSLRNTPVDVTGRVLIPVPPLPAAHGGRPPARRILRSVGCREHGAK